MYCTQPIHRGAQVNPNKIATIYGDRRHTFSEFEQRIARLAGALAEIGVQAGDRVAILALNSDRYLEYFFAVPWIGAVVVPLNIRWSVAENIYSVEDSGSSVLLVDEAQRQIGEGILAGTDTVKHSIYMGDEQTPAGMLNYEQLVANASPVEDVLCGYDELFGIFYTGGTTGSPKGVMLSHQNYYSSSLAAAIALDFNQPGIRYLHAAPMFHIADAAASMANTIIGNTHVFISAFSPQAVVQAVEQHQVTDTLLVPTMVSMMLEQRVFDGTDLSSWRKLIYGASPMPEGTLLEAQKQLPSVNFYQAYGQTELAPMCAVLRPEYHVLEGPLAGKIKAVGQAGPIVEVRIADPEGESLPIGEVGEIWVRGPNTMLGYWNNQKQTEATIVDGWVRTGDAGYLDAEGFLFLVDRIKDMIITGGENVFSAEVESVLSRHLAVQDVAVIGIPHPQWGEAVHAIVRLKAGEETSEQQLIDYCREFIAHYKCPRSIEFREQAFPVTGAGKLRKLDLKKSYWEGKERAIN